MISIHTTHVKKHIPSAYDGHARAVVMKKQIEYFARLLGYRKRNEQGREIRRLSRECSWVVCWQNIVSGCFLYLFSITVLSVSICVFLYITLNNIKSIPSTYKLKYSQYLIETCVCVIASKKVYECLHPGGGFFQSCIFFFFFLKKI